MLKERLFDSRPAKFLGSKKMFAASTAAYIGTYIADCNITSQNVSRLGVSQEGDLVAKSLMLQPNGMELWMHNYGLSVLTLITLATIGRMVAYRTRKDAPSFARGADIMSTLAILGGIAYSGYGALSWLLPSHTF